MRKILFIFFVLLLSFTSCKFIKEKGWFGKGKAAEAEALLIAKQDSIRVADSISLEIEKMKIAEQVKIDSLQAIESERLEQESRFKYHIIVGSFLTPEYADEYTRLYRSKGYDAKIVDDSAYRFKLVSAEVHESLSKAIKRLALYQDTVDFESWLYIKN